MGGRGAFDRTMGRTGGIPVEKRQYSEIGRIDNIKIIQCDAFSNNPTITYSNTANTTYYSYSKKIESNTFIITKIINLLKVLILKIVTRLMRIIGTMALSAEKNMTDIIFMSCPTVIINEQSVKME